ncbi:MAG: sugar phosphate isomerase/epimerase [Armatimonadetes bacterium]|nr:sugar phosphate isomerase/epimerase [Armatimonadota bacterium]
MAKIPVAAQMYTVRDVAAKDFVGTFKEVAKIGYAGVELAGDGGFSAKELRALLEDLNLKIAGNHVGIEKLETALDEAIHYNRELGNPNIVVPYMPEPRRADANGWRQTAKLLNQFGQRCKEAGMVLCYHNHSFEFQKFEGKYGLEILMEETDPSLVYAEVDTYWVQHGGEDPAAFIRRYPGRARLLHLKDMANDAERSFAEVGEGILDFKAIFAAAEVGKTEWYIVEQDVCKRPSINSLRISFENLKKWGIA